MSMMHSTTSSLNMKSRYAFMRHVLFSVMYVPALLILFVFMVGSEAGHEILYNFTLHKDDIQPHELAIIQYDSRQMGSYWNTSVRWNKAYCDRFGHQYFYLMTPSDFSCSYGELNLAPAWCKVKAMIHANAMNTSARAFLFLDSDAIVTLSNYSLTTALGFMRHYLHWDLDKQPVAFNQDGPGWACKFAIDKVGYSRCFNSGYE